MSSAPGRRKCLQKADCSTSAATKKEMFSKL